MANEVVTWLGYDFKVWKADAVRWNDVPGVYIFAGLNSQGHWTPVYVGQTESLVDRLPSHEKWPEAEQRGATHIHARAEESDTRRDGRMAASTESAPASVATAQPRPPPPPPRPPSPPPR